MKLQELLIEMPELQDYDLELGDIMPEDAVYKVSYLEDKFTIISDNEAASERIIVALRNDNQKAIAGFVVGNSLKTQIVLSFHPAPRVGKMRGGQYLQVDLVQARNDAQGTGFGYMLYKSLIDSGYTIISDYTQYRGGKALWEKIVRRGIQDGINVYVMTPDGEFMRDQAGQPIVYDGKNIPQNQIWGRGEQFSNTLLVAQKAR